MRTKSEDNAFVRLANVTKTYPGAKKTAVDNLSLALQPGEILALLGPNGAGKTTTVKMIAGLVLPSSGNIQVRGFDMVQDRTKGVRQLGAVLEGARNLYWRLSARENLLYFGSLRLVPRRDLNQRIDELLKLVDLSDHQHIEVRKYSRGMQQKLAIAAAMLHDPNVLLLDEPTLGLDVQAARKLEETIAILAREQGKGILLTTHTMLLAETLADRVFIIHEGQEVAFASTQELLKKFNGNREATEIRVDGRMAESTIDFLQQMFAGVSAAPNVETTMLTWPEPKQSRVVDLLKYLDEQDEIILEINRRQAKLEEVFISLTERGEKK